MASDDIGQVLLSGPAQGLSRCCAAWGVACSLLRSIPSLMPLMHNECASSCMVESSSSGTEMHSRITVTALNKINSAPMHEHSQLQYAKQEAFLISILSGQAAQAAPAEGPPTECRACCCAFVLAMAWRGLR